jgi:hypothetical protein
VEASGGGLLTVYEQNVERATRAELWRPGEAVTMTWSPDHSFVVADATPQEDGVDGSSAETAPATSPVPGKATDPTMETAATA